jgi:hypothetical protein
VIFGSDIYFPIAISEKRQASAMHHGLPLWRTRRTRNNNKAPRDNRKTRKIGEGGTCIHHGRFVAHKPSECRYKPNSPAVVAATATALSVDEIRAACAADTSAAIQEASEALLAAQATSGKDATSDYPLL